MNVGLETREFGTQQRLSFPQDIDKACTYLGGLDNTDGDGDFAYIWEDDVMQVRKKLRFD